MDETSRQDPQGAERKLMRPDEAIKDLEVDEQDSEAVKGGVPAVQFKDITVTKPTDSSSPGL